MEILHIDPKVLIVQTGAFILLLIVFKLFLFKPVLGILDARRSEIESEYQEAENRRREAEELKTNYEQRLSAIEEEARTRIAEALKEGQAMRDEILADTRVQSERIIARAQEEIQREREKVIHELRKHVTDLAVEAAGKLIEENLDDDKHRKLVAQFIDELEGTRE